MSDLPSQGRLNDDVGTRILQYILRVERLEAEIKELQQDKSEVYKECKAVGLDNKVLKSIIRDRRRDTQELAEEDLVKSMYQEALERAEAAKMFE